MTDNNKYGNIYKVNIDDFTTPDGRYFDFGALDEAVDSGKLKPCNDDEDEVLE